MKGTSNSVGEAPAPAPSSETADKKYSYSYCGIAWYENQEQYTGAVHGIVQYSTIQYTGENCCQECQDNNDLWYTKYYE